MESEPEREDKTTTIKGFAPDDVELNSDRVQATGENSSTKEHDNTREQTAGHNSIEQKTGSLGDSQPLMLFCIAVLFADLLAFPIARSSGIATAPFGAGILGILLSQAILVAIVAGLYSPSWVKGYLIGCGIATLIMLTASVPALLTTGVSVTRDLLVLCWLPWFVLAGSLPMLVYRLATGCYLAISSRPTVVRRKSVESILLLTGFCACILVLVGLPVRAFREQSQVWFGLLISTGIVSIFSGAIVLPISFLYFHPTNPTRRVPKAIFYGSIWFGMFALWILLVVGSGGPAALGMALAVIIAAYFAILGTLMFGLIAMTQAGIELRQVVVVDRPSGAEIAVDVFGEEPVRESEENANSVMTVTPSVPWHNRISLGILVAVTIVASLIFSVFGSSTMLW